MDKILFVSHESTLTGAPLQLLHLVRWLHRAGWNVLVATPEAGPISDLLEADGIAVVIHPHLLEERESAKLRELCAHRDVVVANTIVSWSAVRAAHAEGKRVIWYLHETLLAVRLMREISEIRPTLRLATLLVTPTEQTARIFRDITPTPIEVVPYGIPAPTRIAPSRTNARTAFIVMASLEARKGQDILVEAIKLLPNELQDRANFRFVGRPLDPVFCEKIRDEARGINGVEFIGELDHAASQELLAQSDALICSSRDETMPIAILEAMSLGKGVISTDVGGISEWVRDEMNGLLVAPNDSAALARAMERFLEDARLAARMRAGARRTFEHHFTLEKFAKHFVRLLTSRAPTVRARDVSIGTGYPEWLRETETIERVTLRKKLRQLPQQPLISVLLPVYNPDLSLLKTAIDSVRSQIYQQWELCVADDASTDTSVRPFLEKQAKSEPRIQVIFREGNGHISACSNSALQMATGEWCALLDQDDVVSPDALASVALEIAQHPDAGIIYSDEDKIDTAGVRSNPFFKSDWNPELFLGQNYINHLGVYRAELLREIGGFREGFEGSQDYDLALRCVERLQPGQIRHLPRILYHWRAIAGSLAEVVDAKPYAKEAARRAIDEYLQRRKVAALVEACPESSVSHRVTYELPDPAPLVSVIVPTRDRVELLERCLTSLRERTDYSAMELIVVDNGSVEKKTRDFLQELEKRSDARVVHDDGAFNFSRLINRGAAAACGEVLALLNNDVEAEEPTWLREMVSHAMRNGTGAVGARLWYPDGTLQHGGVVLGFGGVAGHAFSHIPRGHPGYMNRAWLQQNCSAVTGACLVVRREIFERIGGFDGKDLPISFNDIDFCLRLRAAGLENVWTPYANLIHHESATRGHQRTLQEQEQFFREADYMQRTYGQQLLRDPFYNPNLALNSPGYELAFPPRAASAC